MAIEITESPTISNGAVSLDSCIPFKFKNAVDEVGANNYAHKLVWQLQSPAGIGLFEQSAIDYPTPDKEILIEWRLDIMENGFVSTPCPSLTETAVNTIDEMSRTFKVSFWDLILDNDCVAPPSFQNQIDSDLFVVVNSRCQPYDVEPDFNLPQLLTARSHPRTICKNQYEWIYVWIPNNVSTSGLFRIQGDASGLTDLSLVKGKVNAIPIGSIGSSYIGANDTEFQFEIDGIAGTFNYKIDDCCCDEANKQIVFLEPKGGFSSWVFQLTNQTLITESTEICKIQSCDLGLESRLKEKGKTLADIKYYEQVTFRRKFELTAENTELVKAFASNPNKFVVCDINGTDRLIKLLTPTSNYVTYEEEAEIELVVTGVYNLELERNVFNY